MNQVLALAVMVTALVAAGCRGDASGAGRWGGTIDTLPTGMVLVSNPAEGIWADETA